MKVYDTSQVDLDSLPQREVDYIYNGLDCLITHELVDRLRPKLDKHTSQIHDFTFALQAICVDMSVRGILINPAARARIIKDTRKQLDEALANLNELAIAFWGKPLNPKSPKQCGEFFYDFLRLPHVYAKGRKNPTTDDKALEKFKIYFYAKPFVSLIKTCRDLKKKLEALEARISPDGRMRGSFKATGTETGRFSSSKNVFNEGLNLQNQNEYAKRMYVADPGYKLAYIDLEQAESRMLAAFIYALFGDSAYLDACESGDLHTTVCKMIWPELDWPNDNGKGDRAIADLPFYRHFSHRDMAKRGGHGCLTAEHEVLTPEGWVSIAEKPECIMAWNPETEQMQWETPSHWEDKVWTGDLYEIQGNQYSMLCTSDHRMPVFKRSGKFFEQPAEKLKEYPELNLKQTGKFVGGNAPITTQQARLHAAIMADGHIYPNGTVQIGFSKQRKKERFEQLLEGIPHRTREYKPRNETYYIIKPDALGFKAKKRAGAWMLEWPKEALKAWVDEQPYWDGTIQKSFVWIYGKDREHMQWLQTFANLVGQSASYSPNPGHDCARVGFNRRRNRRIGSLKSKKISNTTVRVYCPTVPSSGFIYRKGNEIGYSLNTNYYGKAAHMASQLNVDTILMQNFQENYFRAFPGIPEYHEWIIRTLQTSRTLINPFGRKRIFFGRPGDDATIREAIAYMPQSSIGDLMNLGMWKAWHKYGHRQVQFLAQVHDAILVQYKEELEDEIIPLLLALLPHPLKARDREVIIPCTADVGWNWSKHDPKKKLWADTNPDGLMEYNGHDNRQRTEVIEAKANLLDGIFL